MQILFTHVLLCHERWATPTDVSLGDHVGVHSRESPKGWCVPANEDEHMVAGNLGTSNALELRAREGIDFLWSEEPFNHPTVCALPSMRPLCL